MLPVNGTVCCDIQYSSTARCTMFYLLLIIAATCFGHSFFPSSGSSKCYRRVQLMFQLVLQKFWVGHPLYCHGFLYCPQLGEENTVEVLDIGDQAANGIMFISLL